MIKNERSVLGFWIRPCPTAEQWNNSYQILDRQRLESKSNYLTVSALIEHLNNGNRPALMFRKWVVMYLGEPTAAPATTTLKI